MADFYRSRRPSSGAKMWVNLVLLASVLAAAGVGVPLFLNHAMNDAPAANPAADANTKAIPAVDLFNSYITNEPAAKAKYNDHVVKIMARTGRVWDAEAENVWIVEVVQQAAFLSSDIIQCKFPRDPKSGVLDLKPGDLITVQGICRGFQKGGLTIENCSLIRIPNGKGGEEVMKVNAKEMWNAYLKDSDQAKEQYCGRVIETDGHFARLPGIPAVSSPDAKLFDEPELREQERKGVVSEFMNISCYFTRHPTADEIPSGKVVTAKIRARVGGTLRPFLQECVFVN